MHAQPLKQCPVLLHYLSIYLSVCLYYHGHLYDILCYYHHVKYIIHMYCHLLFQTEDVRKVPSLDSLDLGFPDDDGENQSDGLCFHILTSYIFIYNVRE